MMRPEVQSIGKINLRTLIIIFLAATTIFGLLFGLLYAINLDLSSDMVTPGIVANEIASHGNFQFFFPASDSYLFTDIYTFHLITQILSGYSPLALKLTAYVMFLMVVGIFAYVIYRYSGAMNALIFSSLFANMNPDAYLVFISPENHIGTLIAAGALIALFSVEKLEKASTTYLIIACLIAGLAVLSDWIFLLFFIVPWIIFYLYNYRMKKSDREDETAKKAVKSKKEVARTSSKKQKERSSLDKAVILLLAATALGFVIIFCFGENVNIDVPNFISVPTSLVHLDTVINTKFPLLVQSLAMLLNINLLHLVTGSGNIIFDILLSIIFVSLAVYSLLKPKMNSKYLYWIFLLSAVFMVSGFLFTSWSRGLFSARYLIFVALATVAVIALAYRDDNKIGYNLNTLFLAAVIVLLISTVPVNIAKMSSFDFQPNKEDYAFIDYLKENNFTNGYADISMANTLTYLSNQQLAIRPIQVKNDRIFPVSWLSTKRWYITRNTDYVLILNKNDTLYNDMADILKSNPANNTYYYEGYVIYQYKSDDPREFRWFF